MNDQKARHLQTEEKVLDSPLLHYSVLEPLHTIIALLAGRDLWSFEPSLLLQEGLSLLVDQVKSGFDHPLLDNLHG